MILRPGDKAPDFEMPNADFEVTRLEDILGDNNLVLYFYPKDDTPGCTLEAIDFSDRLDDFASLETVIFGVSTDNCISHGDFRDKHGLTIGLLADIEGSLCDAYSVWHEREVNGETRRGILRSTFIIHKSGTIRHALYDVKPKGHAEAVFKLVQEMVAS